MLGGCGFLEIKTAVFRRMHGCCKDSSSTGIPSWIGGMRKTIPLRFATSHPRRQNPFEMQIPLQWRRYKLIINL